MEFKEVTYVELVERLNWKIIPKYQRAKDHGRKTQKQQTLMGQDVERVLEDLKKDLLFELCWLIEEQLGKLGLGYGLGGLLISKDKSLAAKPFYKDKKANSVVLQIYSLTEITPPNTAPTVPNPKAVLSSFIA